ncbi:hypothetical protein HDV00_000931 [Rhizophlyctis rosea]|nr:hypothetical protein HDV00_000931 [Rhizophlyctis rosea]
MVNDNALPLSPPLNVHAAKFTPYPTAAPASEPEFLVKHTSLRSDSKTDSNSNDIPLPSATKLNAQATDFSPETAASPTAVHVPTQPVRKAKDVAVAYAAEFNLETVASTNSTTSIHIPTQPLQEAKDLATAYAITNKPPP